MKDQITDYIAAFIRIGRIIVSVLRSSLQTLEIIIERAEASLEATGKPEQEVVLEKETEDDGEEERN